jgi:hypothetical protein
MSELASGLRQHAERLPDNQLQCKHCPKTFKYPCHMQIHQRVHNGERPFVCNFCPQTFTQIGNLRSHVRRHVEYGIFPPSTAAASGHSCLLCGEVVQFALKNRHARQHCDEATIEDLLRRG